MVPFRPARFLALLTAASAVATMAGCSSNSTPIHCPAGQTACDGICFDLQADPLSCGTCLHRCATGGICVAGACGCPSGQATCGGPSGQCVDLSSDLFHCGDCSVYCGAGTCAAGGCTCQAGTTTCDGPGTRCVDPLTDTGNCGTCRHGCALGELCVVGTCTCVSPRLVCSGVCIDVQTDEKNCGACGVTCPKGTTCTGSTCRCPASAPDTCGGACVDKQTDEANCGACGARCATGATCVAGHCGNCPAGQTTCGSVCADLSTDHDHCGTCTTACSASQACTQGSCCQAGELVCTSGGGKACCSGTTCCADGCQPAHSNGLGQVYYDCSAPGTYSRPMAQLAAGAWTSAAGATDSDRFVSGNCFSRQTAVACATWCYDGNFAGKVSLNTSSNFCDDPTVASPAWN